MGRKAREPIPPETTALVIVHLSSLMNYIEWYGIKPGQHLVEDLMRGIEEHNGPVVIMDQEWRIFMSEDAGLLYDTFCSVCLQRKNVTWFHHDEWEDVNPWTEGMDQLARLLRQSNVRKVLIGGLWLGKESGCVRFVRQSLIWRRLSAHVIEGLCAFEENDPRAASGERIRDGRFYLEKRNASA